MEVEILKHQIQELSHTKINKMIVGNYYINLYVKAERISTMGNNV
jgi:hypothetical protein